MRAGDAMPKMPANGVDEKQFAILIPIMPPRVRGCRSTAPRRPSAADDSATSCRAWAPAAPPACPAGPHRRDTTRRSGRRASHRPPAQAIGKVVIVLARHGEAIEHHLRRAAGESAGVLVRDEEQLRRAHRPYAALAARDAREHLQGIVIHRALRRVPVALPVFEYHDAIAQPQVELQRTLRIGIILRDPQPPLRIEAHRDGILHRRLRGKDRGLEAWRQGSASRAPPRARSAGDLPCRCCRAWGIRRRRGRWRR